MTTDKQAPPSLEEVICGVVFKELKLDAIDFGAFKASLGDEFPTHQLKYALGAVHFELDPQAALPATRALLSSEDQQWRIQLQHDRFYLSWCRVEGAPYPGFCEPCSDAACVIVKFEQILKALYSFIGSRGLTLELRVAELAKVNRLKRGREWNTTEELGACFAPLGASQRLELPGVASQLARFQWLMEPEEGRWLANARFYPQEEGGLLHVELRSKRAVSEAAAAVEGLRELNAEVNALYRGLIRLQEV